MGLDYASQNKIPLMTIPTEAEVNSVLKGIYQRLGIIAKGNYGATAFAKDFPLSKLLSSSYIERRQLALLMSLDR